MTSAEEAAPTNSELEQDSNLSAYQKSIGMNVLDDNSEQIADAEARESRVVLIVQSIGIVLIIIVIVILGILLYYWCVLREKPNTTGL